MRNNKKQNSKRGGGNYPIDVTSSIPAQKQWSSPYVSAPPPLYNGGRYTGPQFNGPWGNVPVTPTTTNMINQNLKSAEPPPGATTQYPGTNHQGNNFIAMPGVNWYDNTPASNPGEFNLKCTKGGGKKFKKSNKKSQKGGLALYSSNMDCNAPFHPIWNKSYNPKVAHTCKPNMNSFTFIQDGGKKKSKTQIKKSRTRKKSRNQKKRQEGGLALYSSNMDCGAPFHPRWNKSYNPKMAATSRPGMNTYTFIQDGGKKKKKSKKSKRGKKKQQGGLALYSSNMDCNAPFHPTWNKSYNPKIAATSKSGMNTYTFIQDGGKKKNK